MVQSIWVDEQANEGVQRGPDQANNIFKQPFIVVHALFRRNQSPIHQVWQCKSLMIFCKEKTMHSIVLPTLKVLPDLYEYHCFVKYEGKISGGYHI